MHDVEIVHAPNGRYSLYMYGMFEGNFDTYYEAVAESERIIDERNQVNDDV